MSGRFRVAVIDDFQRVAAGVAEWSRVGPDSEIVYFADHLADEEALVARLREFDAIVAMRERTPFPGSLLSKLPRLRLLVATGMFHQTIDFEAAKACGFSRPAFYQAKAAFEQGGLAALIAHKPGPHGAHKLTPAVLEFVSTARAADPGVRADHLAEWTRQHFGVQVHPRSIERQLLRKKKRR